MENWKMGLGVTVSNRSCFTKERAAGYNGIQWANELKGFSQRLGHKFAFLENLLATLDAPKLSGRKKTTNLICPGTDTSKPWTIFVVRKSTWTHAFWVLKELKAAMRASKRKRKS
jgi:hypothetical protein